MWLSRLLTAVLLASIVYLGGSLLLGPYNRDAQASLESHLLRLEDNVSQLRRSNRELLARAEMLERSSDAVTLEARRLGYYREGERVVRFEGHDGRAQRSSPGTILARPNGQPDHMTYVRIAAALVFVVTLVLGGLYSDSEIRRASR